MPVSPKPSVLPQASRGRAWFKACSPRGQWTGASQNQSYRVNSQQQDHHLSYSVKCPWGLKHLLHIISVRLMNM